MLNMLNMLNPVVVAIFPPPVGVLGRVREAPSPTLSANLFGAHP